MQYHQCASLARLFSSDLIIRKQSVSFRIEDILQNQLAWMLQNVNIMEKKKKKKEMRGLFLIRRDSGG